MNNKIFTTRRITVIGMLTALISVLGAAGIGIIEIPGLPFRVTILHIPVIIGALLEGPIVGAIVGLLFGLWSIFDKLFLRPSPTGFVFFNPLISVLPRILIGLIAYYTYNAFNKLLPNSVSISISALLASLTNTIGVLGMIYIIYAAEYMEKVGMAKEFALSFLAGAAVSNGIPEAIASAVIVPIIVIGIKKIRKDI